MVIESVFHTTPEKAPPTNFEAASVAFCTTLCYNHSVKQTKRGHSMSILNGNISYGAIRPEPSPFGCRLSAEKTVALPGCLSLTFDDARDFCFALSSRGLVVLDAKDKRDPREIASLDVVRGGRSIAYAGGYL